MRRFPENNDPLCVLLSLPDEAVFEMFLCGCSLLEVARDGKGLDGIGKGSQGGTPSIPFYPLPSLPTPEAGRSQELQKDDLYLRFWG